jgi:hypothetical protein
LIDKTWLRIPFWVLFGSHTIAAKYSPQQELVLQIEKCKLQIAKCLKLQNNSSVIIPVCAERRIKAASPNSQFETRNNSLTIPSFLSNLYLPTRSKKYRKWQVARSKHPNGSNTLLYSPTNSYSVTQSRHLKTRPVHNSQPATRNRFSFISLLQHPSTSAQYCIYLL